MLGNPLWLDTDKAIIDAVERIATDRNVPMAQIALAWVLRNPVVDSVLSGATKPQHLTDAVAALDIELTGEEVHALEEPYAPRTPTYFA
jgi:aryl-alcohol dehydrogenase-like predicted oxidoreductase